jgi:hypothetical protein
MRHPILSRYIGIATSGYLTAELICIKLKCILQTSLLSDEGLTDTRKVECIHKTPTSTRVLIFRIHVEEEDADFEGNADETENRLPLCRQD